MNTQQEMIWEVTVVTNPGVLVRIVNTFQGNSVHSSVQSDRDLKRLSAECLWVLLDETRIRNRERTGWGMA